MPTTLGLFTRANAISRRSRRNRANRRPSLAQELERRLLLSLTPDEYASLRSTYADFGFPEDPYQVNITDIAPEMLSVAALRDAIAWASYNSMPDLIVLRTTDAQNTIAYTGPQDELSISIPEAYGSITIVSLGTRPLTIDAARQSRVLSVGGGGANTVLNMAGIVLRNGNTSSSGGGIYQESGTMRLTNVTIRDNAANDGGGIYQYGTSATLTNVVISGNTAGTRGGAICQIRNSTTLTNVTISRNTASTGGGIYLEGALSLDNTIVAANSATTSSDIHAYDGSWIWGSSNFIGDGTGQSALVDFVNGNMVGTAAAPRNPMLDEGSAHGLAPVEGSLVIDAGNDAAVPPGLGTDIYGAPRIQGAHVNIGAVETVLPAMPGMTYIVNSLQDTVAADGFVTLREALAAANSNEPVGDLPGGSYANPDRIEFAPGLTGTIPTNGQAYQIGSSVDIVGDANGWLTIDGSNRGRVIEARGDGYTISITGLRLTGGRFDSGGGLYMAGVTLGLTNVTIAGNRASYGGGIYQESGALTLTNVVVADNTALFSGGGLYQAAGSLLAHNATISRNSGASSAGGVFLSGETTLYNTIIALNDAQSSPDVFLYSGSVWGISNLVGNGEGQGPNFMLAAGPVYGNFVGTAANPVDPMLSEGTTPTRGLAPLPGSPALDAGNDSVVPYGLLIDAHGGARIQGGRVNIGAVETPLSVEPGITYLVTSLEDTVAFDGVITLREALQAANTNLPVFDAPAGSASSSDRIQVVPGLTGTIHAHGSPYQVQGSVEISGAEPGAVVLNGDGFGNVMDVTGAGYAVRLQNLYLTGGRNLKDGWLGGYGGGLFTAGANVVLAGVEIYSSTAFAGGGVYQSGGELTLVNVGLALNAGTYGGGVYQYYGTSSYAGVLVDRNWVTDDGGGVLLSGGTATMTGVTITGNDARIGGGLEQSGGTLTMTGSTIAGNVTTSSGQGGGFYLMSGTTAISNTIIHGNSAGWGGGLATVNDVTLTNVTISENVATAYYGGGVYKGWGTLTLTNATISRNKAASAGGGVHQNVDTTIVNNSIIAGNTSPTSPDFRQSGTLTGTNNLIGDGTGQSALVNGVNGNLVGTAATPINPMLAEGTTEGIALAPVAGSPAIDAGDSDLVPGGITTDVYGAPRIQGARVNIGAIETVLAAKPSVVYVVTSLTDFTDADGVLTLREALQAANTNQPAGDAPAGSYSAPDRIEFAPGLTGTLTAHSQPYQILGSLDLVGPGASQLTINVYGAMYRSIFDIQGPGYTVALRGLKVTGGIASKGGAIFNSGAALTLQDMLITDNSAINGGGIYQSGGTLAMTNVTISLNTASGSSGLSTCGGGVYLEQANATLTNVTLSDNWAPNGDGGAVYQSGGTATLTGVTIARNKAMGSGGGWYRSSGALAMTAGSVSENTAYNGAGGGIYQSSGSSALTNVAFWDNTAATFGGGMYNANGIHTLTGVTLNVNKVTLASGSGGGVYQSGGTLIATNTLVRANTAASGGGIYSSSAMVTLTNVVVCGNKATTRQGGGLYQYYGSATLTNVTFAGNTAATYGGGIYRYYATTSLNNSIIARNTAANHPDVSNQMSNTNTLTGSNNLIGDGTGQLSLVHGTSGNLVGTSAAPINPQFRFMFLDDPWYVWNLSLTAASPAVNTGSNAHIPSGITTDVAGGPRILGGTVDMGAYERDLDAPTVASVLINDGSAQRSMVKSITVTFSEPVTFYTGSLQVKLMDGSLPPNATVTTSNPSGDDKTYILTFTGTAILGGSLADGIYDLSITAWHVQDQAGNYLTANFSQRFHRLFGDSDGNRIVNALDYARLKNSFARSSSDPLFNSAFDYEGNNLINALDLARFRQRYGLVYSY